MSVNMLFAPWFFLFFFGIHESEMDGVGPTDEIYERAQENG